MPRLRSSVLVKVVVALALALMVSSTVTSVVAARLTRSVLDAKGRQLGKGQLGILQEAYNERERTLNVNLKNLAQIFNARGLFGRLQRPELIAELGRASSNLDLDLLRVLDERGRELEPGGAGVGGHLADPETLIHRPGEGSDSQLILTSAGGLVQATQVATVYGDKRLVLVGGHSFSDRFAYRLRKQIGSLDDVLLVASGRVVGSTLPDPPQRPPSPGGTELPSSPVTVDIDGVERMVAYVPVGAANDPANAAIGLIFSDSVTPLDQSLARTRLTTTVLLTFVTLGLAWLLFRFLIRPLVRLADTAGKIAGGDLDAGFEASTGDEIGMLASALERMRLELRTKLEVIASQASDLRESSQRIVAAEDKERHRLARDLHDGIQQQLVVLRMQVAMAMDGTGVADPATMSKFEHLGQALDGVIERLREVTQNLYPSILLDRGLVPATRSHVGRLPVYARLTSRPDPFPRLAVEIESAAYFLICEALTNSLKHSGASETLISLACEGEWLEVTVQDNGRGFKADEVQRRGGLLHMQDRVRSYGGELRIESTPGAGATVTATFPHWLVDTQVMEPDGVEVTPAGAESGGGAPSGGNGQSAFL